MYNSIRSRAYQDMRLFGQTSMGVGVNQIKELMSPAQMADFSAYCIIPKDPSVPMTRENAVAVTNAQRRYVVGTWKPKRDAAAYRLALSYILESPVVQ